MFATVAIIVVVLIVLSLAIYLGISLSLKYNDTPDYTLSKYGTATELPVIEHLKNSRIAVFMVATKEIEVYSRYTTTQNKAWADSHGYDFFVYDQNVLPDLPINFSKIQYSLDLLATGKYDYVMYIDADAIVHTKFYDVRHLIGKYMTGLRSIMFGEDCFSSKDCSKPGRINSGVFVVKNTIWGKAVLDKWKTSARGECKDCVNVFPNCQLVFTKCVRPWLFFAVVIIPFNLMNGFGDSLFIKHAMAMDNVERIGELKKMYRSGDDRVRVY
jgi:hypothetical protein